MDVSKAERSKVDKKVKLEVNWQHVEEVSPSFKKLMMILLKLGSSQQVETARIDEEHQNEQC